MRIYIYLAIVIIYSGCAPARFVKPLDEKQLAVNASLGGPLFQNFGAPIPMPLTTIVAGYGLKNDITIFGGIHPTAMSFGAIQTEFGILKGIISPDRWQPGLSTALAFNTAIYKDFDFSTFRIWPAWDVNAYWHIKERPDIFYFGVSNWFEFSGTRAHHEPQQWHWLPNLQTGYSLVRPKMEYNIEVKYMALQVNNEKIVVEDVDLGGRGSLGIYFSITRKF